MRTIQNAEINSLDQDKNKFPSIVIKTKGKNNNNNKKYDISINNNEFNVLDDLDIDLAENTKTDSERNE